MSGIKTSKLTLGGAPEERIQLSKAYDFRVLMTQKSAVTFLTKGVICGWGGLSSKLLLGLILYPDKHLRPEWWHFHQ